MKEFNTISIIIGAIGGFFAWLLGGFDVLTKAFLAIMITDYILGVIAAWYKEELSSQIGFKGLLKKVATILIVGMVTQMDQALGGSMPFREVTIMFYIANDGISCLENTAKMGMPWPESVKKVLLQLRDNKNSNTAGTDGENNGSE